MLPQLPFDVLVHILAQLPASRDAEGEVYANTLASCSQTDSAFHQAASVSMLWEPHYRTRYIHCDKSAESLRKSSFDGDWRLMYAERRRKDREALSLLDKIVAQRAGRCKHATKLSRLSFDVWDALEIETQILEMSLSFYDEDTRPSIAPTRAFWASSMLKAISRTYAVQLWSRLQLGHNGVSFVEAFSATSCFFGSAPEEMSSILDGLARRCREYLLHLNCPLPEDELYDVTKICAAICDFLHSEGFGAVQPHNFHDVNNLFPHKYLTTHKRTIPLSLVHIFVAIARALGITASPVDFPLRVLAHVSVTDPDVDDLYVDVYGSDAKAILSLRDDIPELLARQGIHPSAMLDYISPCGAVPMLSRSGRNIFSSLRAHSEVSSTIFRDSVLLAFSINLILSNSYQIIPQMMSQAEPLDCATFISEGLIPGLQPASMASEELSSSCQQVLEQEEQEASVIYLRSQENTSIQHFVGMIFKHRKYKYTGCIYGWNPICAASEEWIREMNVRALPRGKNQPFYSAFCADDTVRYVAEDNIQPILNPEKDVFEQLFTSIPSLTRYFTGVQISEVTERMRFTLSPELQVSYPEDEAIGQAWLRCP